jgi:hypothetical protein
VERSSSAGGYFHGYLELGNPPKSSIEAEVRRPLQLAIMDSWLRGRLSTQWLQYVSFEGRLAWHKHYFSNSESKTLLSLVSITDFTVRCWFISFQ